MHGLSLVCTVQSMFILVCLEQKKRLPPKQNQGLHLSLFSEAQWLEAWTSKIGEPQAWPPSYMSVRFELHLAPGQTKQSPPNKCSHNMPGIPGAGVETPPAGHHAIAKRLRANQEQPPCPSHSETMYGICFGVEDILEHPCREGEDPNSLKKKISVWNWNYNLRNCNSPGQWPDQRVLGFECVWVLTPLRISLHNDLVSKKEYNHARCEKCFQKDCPHHPDRNTRQEQKRAHKREGQHQQFEDENTLCLRGCKPNICSW